MIYVTFFTGKDGRMELNQFRALCEAYDYDPETVECAAKELGYFYSPVYGTIMLIDMIGFEFPFEIYDVMK